MHKVMCFLALSIAATGLLLSSCRPQADININAPKEPIRIEVKVELHIYQHAVKNIDYVTGGSVPEEAKPETPAEEKPKEKAPPPADQKEGGAGSVFLRLLGIGEAYAETVPDQQQLQRLLNSMRSRFPTLKRYKADGSIGENRSGLVQERPSPKMSDRNYANAVRAIINAENADRRLLYQTQARIDRASLAQVTAAYAQGWRDKASPGEWIEVLVGGKWQWKQK